MVDFLYQGTYQIQETKIQDAEEVTSANLEDGGAKAEEAQPNSGKCKATLEICLRRIMC